MKKQVSLLLAIAVFTGIIAHAQPETTPSKTKVETEEKKEIFIKKSGKGNQRTIAIERKLNDGENKKMTIVIDGEKVTINGKPAKDFNGSMNFFDDKDFDGDFNINLNGFGKTAPLAGIKNFGSFKSNKALLGVTSEVVSNGAKITDLSKESAAEKADLQVGDIITAINADRVSAENNLSKLIGKYKPEESVDILFLRDGKEKKQQVVLGKSPVYSSSAWGITGLENNRLLNQIYSKPRGVFGENIQLAELSGKPKFGFSIADNEDGDGVKITDVKEATNAEKAGLKKDDLITEANGMVTKNTDELKRQLADARDKLEVTLKIMRNGTAQTLTLKVPKKIKTADL